MAQHPALPSRHSGARFDIITQEWPAGAPGIKIMRVWFYFDRKSDADTALKILVGRFKTADAKVETVRREDSRIVTLYRRTEGMLGWTSDKLIFRKGTTADAKYSILFTSASGDGEPWQAEI